MNKKTIKGGEQFQILAHSMGISPSAEGFTLNYSANGKDFTAWTEATPANENLMVINFPKGMYFKLVGNNSDVTVTF